MRAVYLVRHGRADNGGKSFCLGRTDISLSRAGEREAEKLRSWFASHPVERIISSPLSRCRQTGEKISGAEGLLEIDGDLIEMDAGRWENMPFDEIKKQYPDLYVERGKCLGLIPPPGGESFYQGDTTVRSDTADPEANGRRYCPGKPQRSDPGTDLYDNAW